MPTMPMLDNTSEEGDAVEVETLQAAQPRPPSQTPQQGQSERQSILPVHNDAGPPNMAPRPSFKQDETTQLVTQNQSQPAPTIVERIRMEHSTEVPSAGSPPKQVDPLQTPTSHQEKEKSPQPLLTPPTSPPPASRSELEQALESLRNQNRRDAKYAPDAAPERKGESPLKAAPAPLPENQASAGVVPEQIVITHKELQPPKADSPRLVPALATPERKSHTEMQQSELQPPTIHVTIGRIEVKATTPAPLPKRSASAPTTMSLDEYLRRRQGGNQ